MLNPATDTSWKRIFKEGIRKSERIIKVGLITIGRAKALVRITSDDFQSDYPLFLIIGKLCGMIISGSVQSKIQKFMLCKPGTGKLHPTLHVNDHRTRRFGI